MDKEFLLQQGLSPEGADAVLQAHQQKILEYEEKMRTMGAQSALKQAVTAAGGRNLTAIRALVDETAIAQSQDMDAAAAQAVEALRRDSPYLFAVPQVYAPGTGTEGGRAGYSMEELGKLSLADYRRYRKGN
jgi:hypothetical protein